MDQDRVDLDHMDWDHVDLDPGLCLKASVSPNRTRDDLHLF